MSDKECLVPEIVHKKGKLVSQIIYWNVRETVKHQQYVFETLWNKAFSAQQKINQIEKGEVPEVIEVIRDTNENNESNGDPDQILTWGGPIAAFRWDDGNSIDIKNLSVREIVPPQ